MAINQLSYHYHKMHGIIKMKIEYSIILIYLPCINSLNSSNLSYFKNNNNDNIINNNDNIIITYLALLIPVLLFFTENFLLIMSNKVIEVFINSSTVT